MGHGVRAPFPSPAALIVGSFCSRGCGCAIYLPTYQVTITRDTFFVYVFHPLTGITRFSTGKMSEHYVQQFEATCHQTCGTNV